MRNWQTLALAGGLLAGSSAGLAGCAMSEVEAMAVAQDLDEAIDSLGAIDDAEDAPIDDVAEGVEAEQVGDTSEPMTELTPVDAAEPEPSWVTGNDRGAWPVVHAGSVEPPLLGEVADRFRGWPPCLGGMPSAAAADDFEARAERALRGHVE